MIGNSNMHILRKAFGNKDNQYAKTKTLSILYLYCLPFLLLFQVNCKPEEPRLTTWTEFIKSQSICPRNKRWTSFFLIPRKNFIEITQTNPMRIWSWNKCYKICSKIILKSFIFRRVTTKHVPICSISSSIT